MAIDKFVHEFFLDVYDKYADGLFRACFFSVRDKDMAEDVVQETFVKIYEYVSINGIKSVKNVRAFLYMIMRNKMIDEIRRRKHFSLEFDEEYFVPVFDGTAKNDEVEKINLKMEMRFLMTILDKLEPDEKNAVILRYLYELSPKEIGVILKTSPNVVSVRICRALQKIRNIANKMQLKEPVDHKKAS